jgi:hypothetical protein
MALHLYDEAGLPNAGAVEDIDSINALLAMERLTEANESFRIEPLPPEDEPEDEFLESAFEDLSDPFGQLDD